MASIVVRIVPDGRGAAILSGSAPGSIDTSTFGEPDSRPIGGSAIRRVHPRAVSEAALPGVASGYLSVRPAAEVGSGGGSLDNGHTKGIPPKAQL